jgi:hypothetical protein
LVLPTALYADGFDYTFVEGGIVNTEVEVGPIDVDGDGFGVNGSFRITDNVHFLAGYSDQDYDFGIDGNTLSAGVGLNMGINEDLDFVANLSYIDAEIDTPFGSAGEDGYGVGAGIRARAGEKVEIDAGLNYVDLDESDTVLSVGGRYYFNDSFALTGGLSDADAGLSWSIGLRAEFGGR